MNMQKTHPAAVAHGAARSGPAPSTSRLLRSAAIYLALIVLAITFMIPLFWMLSTSLKSRFEVFAYPPEIIPGTIQWGNFSEIFTRVPLGRYMLNTLVLVIANVIGQSFKAWPLGHGFGNHLLEAVAYNVAWIFSAAMLLAIPVVFSTIVVQLGFGFLNRVAPSLNLFALGFSVITIFGLLMLAQIVKFIPEHYIRMTNMVLEMIRQQMQVAHG